MAQLSNRLQRLAPSATLAMSQKSSEMKAQGIDVINLSVGEPDFNTPDRIKEAAKQAVDENYSRYSPVPGYPELRKAIVEKLKRENGLDYTTNEILVSNGAKQSVCNTVMALVNPGEEVIIPAPYWVSYPQMALLAGGTPVFVEATFEQNFKMTPEQLEAAITPKTRLIILCSPSNPTGSVYNKEELRALANIILKHEDLFVLADEIYEHINYVGHHESIAQFPGMKERTIIVNGVSKAYAMTGWRIGFVAFKGDGTRIYSDITRATYNDANHSISFDCPAGCTHVWLVVSGAPTSYWSRDLTNWVESTAEQWPYRVKFYMTNVYGEPNNGVPSGIEEIAGGNQQANDENVYSISGQLVRQGTTSLDGLPHGIYIVAGKKVLK